MSFTFLKSANKLGPELNLALDQIRDLDAEAHRLAARAEEDCQAALLQSDASGRGQGVRATSLRAVLEMQRRVVGLSSEKVNVASSLYQTIDKQIRSLDKQLQALLDDITRRQIALGLQPGLPSAAAGAADAKAKRKRGKAEDAPAAAPEGDAAPEEAVPIPAGCITHEFHFPGMEPFKLPVDPSEPKYCSCQQWSWGNMVGCEGEMCPYEWFHLPCVGLTELPTSKKWYCPSCRGSQDRKPPKRGKLKG